MEKLARTWLLPWGPKAVPGTTATFASFKKYSARSKSSFIPSSLSINPLTFAIEPIRMAYHNSVDLRAVLINAPYGDVNGYSCLAILLILTVGLFFLIRPLLNRKLA